jgi:hypothetical protein
MQKPGYSLCDLIYEVMRCPIGFLNSHPTTCIGWGKLIKWSLRCLFNEAAAVEREGETNSTDTQLITWTSYALMRRTSKFNFLA